MLIREGQKLNYSKEIFKVRVKGVYTQLVCLTEATVLKGLVVLPSFPKVKPIV